MILYENGSTKGNKEGTTFTINDTSNGRTLKFYKYEGQTTQEGTPTPSSPQSINVVTGNNTITITNSDNTQTQTYSLNLGSTELCKIGNYQDSIYYQDSSVNLFDDSIKSNTCLNQSGNIVAENNANIIKVNCKSGDFYTIRATFSTASNSGVIVLAFFDENDNLLNRYATSNGTTLTLSKEAPTNTAYLYAGHYNIIPTTIQLEKNSSASSYQPYGSGWYIKKNIGKVVLNGSESWVQSGLTSNTNFVGALSGANMTNLFDCLINTSSQAKSNYFIGYDRSSNIQTKEGMCFYNTSGNKHTAFALSIFKSTLSDLTSFQTWLSTHNTSVYYVLATPTYTKITDTDLIDELDALENATTYDNQTNITQTNDGLPLYTYVEYVQPLDFSRNGLGVIPNVLNAKVVDEINGEYSLTFEYPMSEPMATELVEDRIVKCKVADGTSQCFIIKKIQKNFDKMSVYCTHLFYLLYDNFLEDTYPQNLSPKPFLDHILSRANYQLPFTTTSDIAATSTARYVRKNCVEAILGDIDNSMYNLFGMELKRDNWNIGLKARLGSDKGEKLIFGKNITGVDVNIDTTGVYTRIMPIGFDGLLLPEKYVDADNINEYPYPRICLYEFPDIVYDPEQEGAYHNLEDAYQALRDAVSELYANGINKPLINISVNWVELSKTEEYKQYSALERVDLGDTLTCNLFGMDYTTRVIKTEYNPLTDRIDKFEIGTFQPNIATSMNKVEFDITQINPSSILEQAQENATSLITQAMGGYVYKTNNELYIMDNEDPNLAVKVWRWNINGLGYSSTGINGTYGLAMTMDGAIVADFITTGTIATGVLSGANVVDAINGTTSQVTIDADKINLNGAVTANNNFKIKNDGSVEVNNGTIDLVDNGTSETIPKIKVTSRDNVVTNEIYSYGMEINNTNGNKIEIGTSTTDHFNAQKIISGNEKEVFEITEDGGIISQYYDTNNNVTRWSTLFPGTDYDSAFTLGTGSSTNFEIHNEQNNTYAKVKGSLVATDNNGNNTFSVDGATGNTTIGGDLTVNGIIKGLNIPYCLYYSRDFTQNFSPWVNTQINFTSGTTLWATNTDDFSVNGDYVKVNFDGVVLIMRQTSQQYNGEFDIVDELGAKVGLNYGNNSISILGVSNGTNIDFSVTTGASSVYIWNVRLIVIRLS